MLLTTFLSLFSRTLARSLYKPLTKLIGLKSFRSLHTPLPLLLPSLWHQFKLLSKDLKSQNSIKNPITSHFTKSHKTPRKPFQPRASSPLKLDNVARTSILEMESLFFFNRTPHMKILKEKEVQ